MTSKKRFYSPSFNEAKQFWVRYRWEFMRRDPEYIKAYNEILELQNQVERSHDADDTEVSLIHEEKLSLFPKKFDMFLPFMWDPNKTFDEITKKGKRLRDLLKLFFDSPTKVKEMIGQMFSRIKAQDGLFTRTLYNKEGYRRVHKDML